MGKHAAVFMAAAMESVVAEVLFQAGESARGRRRVRITPQDLRAALSCRSGGGGGGPRAAADDTAEDLCELASDAVVPLQGPRASSAATIALRAPKRVPCFDELMLEHSTFEALQRQADSGSAILVLLLNKADRVTKSVCKARDMMFTRDTKRRLFECRGKNDTRPVNEKEVFFRFPLGEYIYVVPLADARAAENGGAQWMYVLREAQPRRTLPWTMSNDVRLHRLGAGMSEAHCQDHTAVSVWRLHPVTSATERKRLAAQARKRLRK